MINTQLEDLVELALDSLSSVIITPDKYDLLEVFELEFRRALMKKYCNNSPVTKNSFTYTINSGEGLTGKWSTNKQILNG